MLLQRVHDKQHRRTEQSPNASEDKTSQMSPYSHEHYFDSTVNLAYQEFLPTENSYSTLQIRGKGLPYLTELTISMLRTPLQALL